MFQISNFKDEAKKKPYNDFKSIRVSEAHSLLFPAAQSLELQQDMCVSSHIMSNANININSRAGKLRGRYRESNVEVRC